MQIIGLTGGIASGKSTASEYMLRLGYPVFDADEATHALQQCGERGWQAIYEVFGAKYFFDNGNINRAALGNLVFQNEKAMKQLNAIMHPMIVEEAKKWIDMQLSKGEKIVILDAALLIETGMHALCSEVWLVSAPISLRLERLMKRNSLSEQEAMHRIQSQMDEEEKRGVADVILDNSCSPQSLYEQIMMQLKRIRAGFGASGEESRKGNI